MVSITASDMQEKLAPSAAGEVENPAEINGIPVAAIPPSIPTSKVPLRPAPLTSSAFTPRFLSESHLPFMFTPNTATKHLSAAFGLATPIPTTSKDQRQPFGTPAVGGQAEITVTTAPTPVSARRPPPCPQGSVPAPQEPPLPEHPPAPEPLELGGHDAAASALTPPEDTSPQSQNMPGDSEGGKTASDVEKEGSGSGKEQARTGSGRRAKPKLTVVIPDANRDDAVIDTPSGLQISASPCRGGEMLPSLASARFPGMSPTAFGMFAPWNPLASATERDGGGVPLTPFLNMEGYGEGGFGGSVNLLPSPSGAGLVPLTPRMFGFDGLMSARSDGPPTLGSKRGLEVVDVENEEPAAKRQQT